jgi:dihydrofolate reductase
MGRKTYQSIGRPLPGREMVVITRDPNFKADGIHVVDSLQGALVLGDLLAKERGAAEVIVAGGASVYAEAMVYADRLLLTELDLEAEGDAVFPPVDPTVWKEVSRVAHERQDGDDAGFDVVTLVRR